MNQRRAPVERRRRPCLVASLAPPPDHHGVSVVAVDGGDVLPAVRLRKSERDDAAHAGRVHDLLQLLTAVHRVPHAHERTAAQLPRGRGVGFIQSALDNWQAYR
jgi:hypothetical protein